MPPRKVWNTEFAFPGPPYDMRFLLKLAPMPFLGLVRAAFVNANEQYVQVTFGYVQEHILARPQPLSPEVENSCPATIARAVDFNVPLPLRKGFSVMSRSRFRDVIAHARERHRCGRTKLRCGRTKLRPCLQSRS